ncbi:hypothetical protein [Stenotrophomonas sp. CFBP 13718]|uniref:hypothetical protein n=1 Tax=Stenotrophomonas sp. CFBP 13718 TaxID=2775304 RepID=UPI001781A79F|nr:hypothetical protein [Stenotrophomonas sp. CFBP 13718]MBD8698178.1 hypothetical protein [Stenotrophomonas sp. CFBP 13718]
MSGQEPLEIEMAGVKFYSAQDELYFFAWLKGIGSVSDVFGQGRAIYAVVDRDEITFDDASNSSHFFFGIKFPCLSSNV